MEQCMKKQSCFLRHVKTCSSTPRGLALFCGFTFLRHVKCNPPHIEERASRFLSLFFVENTELRKNHTRHTKNSNPSNHTSPTNHNKHAKPNHPMMELKPTIQIMQVIPIMSIKKVQCRVQYTVPLQCQVPSTTLTWYSTH